MRKSERDALLERAKKLRRRKQQRAEFTDFMAMSESPLVKQAQERLDGRAGAKATKGRLNLLTPKAAQADTKVAPPTPKRQSKDKSDPRGNQIKATPGTAKKKEPTKKFKQPTKKFNVGVSKGGVSFKEAFKHFRGLGQSTFTWNGKKYTTDVKKAKPKAKISTPLPADFAKPTKTEPKKKTTAKKKTTTKSNDPRKGFSSKATPGSNLPAGALRKFNSKTGYNSKKERLKKVGDTTYVFKKG